MWTLEDGGISWIKSDFSGLAVPLGSFKIRRVTLDRKTEIVGWVPQKSVLLFDTVWVYCRLQETQSNFGGTRSWGKRLQCLPGVDLGRLRDAIDGGQSRC
jgi:hypothetical protein